MTRPRHMAPPPTSWSGFLVQRSAWILGVTAVITALAATQLARASFNPDISGILLDGKRGRELLAHRERFSAGEPITVLVRLSDGRRFTDKQPLVDLLGFRDALAAVPGVSSVTSLVPARNPLTGEPVTRETIESVPEHLLARLLATSLADLFVDGSRRNTLLLVAPAHDSDAIALVGELRAVAAPQGFEVRLAGTPVILGTMIDALGWRVLAMPLLVLLLLLGTFYLTLRSVKATLISFAPAVLGTLWVFGLLFGLGFQLNLLTVTLPLFVLVMGSADGLHLVTYIRQDAAREPTRPRRERIDRALSRVGVPMVLTTVSTAIGFGSLLLTDIRPVRELGAFVACGMVFAGLISWFSLPALLTRIDITPRAAAALASHTSWVSRLLSALTRRRYVAAALTAAIIGAGAWFIPRLEVDADPLFFFDEREPIHEGFTRMTQMFGGGTPLTGEFAYDPRKPNAPQLAHMRDVSHELERLPGVKSVFSLADIALFLPERSVRAALRGDDVGGIGKVASGHSVLFVLLPGEHESAMLRRWLAFADTRDDIVTLTGTSVLFDELNQRVLDGFARSLVAAFVLIALLLAVAYRSQWELLVALLPLTLTTGALLAFIAASGMHVNLTTAVVSGIVIGVGIDYAIHMMAAIHHERALGDGYVGRALALAGVPILANALGIALSMSALWLSPIRPPGQIAAIMWVSMLVGALSALVIIPACYPRHALSARATQSA